MNTFAGDVELRHFSPLEFDHPELMHPGFLVELDELRAFCGFPIRITDDARTDADMTRIYGPDRQEWPDSAHLYRPGYRVRAVDVKPAGQLDFHERERRELVIVHHATLYMLEGVWPNLGLEVATRHLHLDDYDRPGRVARRPTVFPGVSR